MVVGLYCALVGGKEDCYRSADGDTDKGGVPDYYESKEEDDSGNHEKSAEAEGIEKS